MLKISFSLKKGSFDCFILKVEKRLLIIFFKEGDFVAGAESTFLQRKSVYGIEVLEEAVITAVPFSLINTLAVDSIAVNKLIQSILLQSLIGFSSRLQSLQFETAHERYQKLINQHPEILLRAPLGDIASFLGISQQTLSVIRAQR